MNILRMALILTFCCLPPVGPCSGPSAQAASQSRLDQPSENLALTDVLEKTADYCSKLDRSAFDFICLEEIEEKINFYRDIQNYLDRHSVSPGSQDWGQIALPKEKVTRTFVYDYQVIRKAGLVTEKRALLEENGKKRREDDARLKTAVFQFRNVLFAPIGVLSKPLQLYYDYKIVNEAALNGEAVLIVEAKPKPGFKSEFLYGKVWLRKADGGILKIEWDQAGIGNYAIFERRAESYGAQPRIALTSEFATEKSGIRFPSRFAIEEAYILKNGKKFVRSVTTVAYSQFKFFTVEVSVD